MNDRQSPGLMMANHSMAMRNMHEFMKRDIGRNERQTNFFRPLSEALGSGHAHPIVDSQIKVVSDYLSIVFLRQAANPSKSSAVLRLQDTFSREAYLKAGNYLSFVSNLEDQIQVKDEVAIVGDRGCGKTAIINEWLNERTHPLLEGKLGLVWFRIDVTKIYNIHRKGTSSRHRMSMVDYFKCHSTYVFLEYSGVLQNPYADASDKASALLVRIAEELQTGPNWQEFKDIVNIVAAFYASLSSIDGIFQRPSETLIRELCKDVNITTRKAFSRLFELFCHACSEQKVGIMAIIDGIDNVSWSLKDDIYQTMCGESRQFIQRFADVCPNMTRKILLVARSETVPELNIVERTDNREHARGIDRATEFEVLPMMRADPVAVLGKKLSAAELSKWFEKERDLCTHNLQTIDSKTPGSEQLKDLLHSYRVDYRDFLRTVSVRSTA